MSSGLPGGVQIIFEETKNFRGTGNESTAYAIPSSITSDVEFRLGESRWSFSAWIRGDDWQFTIFQIQYPSMTEGLYIENQRLQWRRSRKFRRGLRSTQPDQGRFLSDEYVWTDKLIGHHLFFVHSYREVTIYIDGSEINRWYVTENFVSPLHNDREIKIGQPGPIYEMGEVRYYFKNVQDQQLLSAHFELQYLDWVHKTDECSYCLSSGDISTLSIVSILTVLGLLAMFSLSAGYNRFRNLEYARSKGIFTFYLATLGHTSDIAFVISSLSVDYRFGFIGIVLLSVRLVAAVFVYMASVPILPQWQLYMLAMSGGHLEATIRFMTSGFLADVLFFTSTVDFEPILQSHYTLLQPFFSFLLLCYQFYWTYVYEFYVTALISMWFSTMLIVYKFGGHCFKKTTYVHLAMLPPVESNLMSFSISEKIRQKIKETMHVHVNNPKQIIQSNNTAFTLIRIEVDHHSKSDIPDSEVENMGVLILLAYKDLFNVDDESATCIPLNRLETIKSRLHELGIDKEDHMLTVGGASMSKRTTIVAQAIKNLTRLALDEELKSHRRRIGNYSEHEVSAFADSNSNETPTINADMSARDSFMKSRYDRRLPESTLMMSNLREQSLKEGGFETTKFSSPKRVPRNATSPMSRKWTVDDQLPFEGVEMAENDVAITPAPIKQVLEGESRKTVFLGENGIALSRWDLDVDDPLEDVSFAGGASFDEGEEARHSELQPGARPRFSLVQDSLKL